MRVLHGEQILVRVFIGESDRWHHQPLHVALIERLRKEGFAGATVLRGVGGFGANSRIHTAKILRLSEDLPILIEIVDTEDKIRQALPELDDMMEASGGGGLITLEFAEIIKYTQ